MSGAVLGTAPDDRVRRGLSVARRGGVSALRKGNLKLHYLWSEGELDLYDMAKDPTEQNDLYNPADPTSAELWELMEPWVDEAHALAEDVDMKRYAVEYMKQMGSLDYTRWYENNRQCRKFCARTFGKTMPSRLEIRVQTWTQSGNR